MTAERIARVAVRAWDQRPRLAPATARVVAGVAGVVLACLVGSSVASAATFSNTDPITINDGNSCDPAVATPYPSTISVSGVAAVEDVDVTLSGFTHTWPGDVRVLLVGPRGQTVLLLHREGFDVSAVDLTLTFDDAAADQVPVDALSSGSYRPSGQSVLNACGGGPTVSFPDPAPAGPYGSTLSAFDGTDPTGDWKLYVSDVQGIDVGSIAGWSLDFGEVQYPFTGFLAPIANDALNVLRAGQGVPVKFSLGGDRGLGILATTPTSRPVPCDGTLPSDPVEQTDTAGASGLSYDAATGTYTYTWKSEKAWANTCRQLTVTLIDGTSHSALFKLG